MSSSNIPTLFKQFQQIFAGTFLLGLLCTDRVYTKVIREHVLVGDYKTLDNIVPWIGLVVALISIAALSYYGYKISNKRSYLFLGLLGLGSYISIIGYAVIHSAYKKYQVAEHAQGLSVDTSSVSESIEGSNLAQEAAQASRSVRMLVIVLVGIPIMLIVALIIAGVVDKVLNS